MQNNRDQAAPDGVEFIGVDVGATHVRTAVVSNGSISHVVSVRLSELPTDGALNHILAAIRDAHVSHPATRGRPIGIGVAGVVDEAGDLRDQLALGLPGGSVLRRRVEDAFEVICEIDNDANMAALGEFGYGEARGAHSFSLLSLGTNIGMGTVYGGKTVRGFSGSAGEVGTIPIDASTVEPERLRRLIADRDEFAQPPHGMVWAEELYGGRAILREYLAGEPGGGSIRVLQRAALGDQRALRIVDDALLGWAMLMAAAARTLDPELFLIGGGLSADLLPFLPQLQGHVTALIPRSTPDIRLATLGPDAGVIGAATAAASIGSKTLVA